MSPLKLSGSPIFGGSGIRCVWATHAGMEQRERRFAENTVDQSAGNAAFRATGLKRLSDDLDAYGGIDIDCAIHGTNRNNQGIAYTPVIALVGGIFSPPTTNWIDRDGGTLRKIGSGATPIVRMNRTDISKTFTQHPIVGTSIDGRQTLFFRDGHLINPGPECVDRFQASLHPKSQIVRCVAVTAEPAAFAGVRLDEV